MRRTATATLAISPPSNAKHTAVHDLMMCLSCLLEGILLLLLFAVLAYALHHHHQPLRQSSREQPPQSQVGQLLERIYREREDSRRRAHKTIIIARLIGGGAWRNECR